MLVGDSIICVDLKGIGDKVPMTVGKKYEILSITSDGLIEVISDIGTYTYYLKSRFILLDDFRADKLNKLLGEVE
jgi:hypothetical protein